MHINSFSSIKTIFKHEEPCLKQKKERTEQEICFPALELQISLHQKEAVLLWEMAGWGPGRQCARGGWSALAHTLDGKAAIEDGVKRSGHQPEEAQLAQNGTIEHK